MAPERPHILPHGCHQAHTRTAQEALREDFQGPTYAHKLREAINEGLLPPNYDAHPIVQRHSGSLVAPIAVYMDALPYSLVDSVLGVWLINLVTGARHVLLVLRKKMVCSCGCRGWCTYYPILLWLRWCLECLAEGRWPSHRHDGSAFGSQDELRTTMAGVAMEYAAAVLKAKGDWSEFCERFGFPNWNSGMRPCFCCNGFGPELYSAVGVNRFDLPWRLNQDSDYEQACNSCEIWITVDSSESHKRLCAALHWDMRSDGARGRSLKHDLEIFGLSKNDRLEPHADLVDVAQFDHISEFPCRVLFWRRSRETLCTHRCPLFSSALGLTPASIAIDALHTLLLGPFLSWGKLAIWKLLSCGVWGALEDNNESRLKVAIMVLRTALHAWYKAEQSAGRLHSRIDAITAKMIGTASNQTLKLKAMEAYGFVQFLLHSLVRFQVPDSASLVAAGRPLVQLVEVMKAAPARLSSETIDEMLHLWKRHMSILHGSGAFAPKHHLMFHMVLRSSVHGNPWRDATFRFAHQTTFESTVILKITEVLKRMRSKRRLH